MEERLQRMDEKYMARCLQLAALGNGTVSPNPMVGAVLVCDGEIIGEGYHRCCGEAHAEVNAVASVKDSQKLACATLYVSLEPCSHYGKTPPCTELILKHRIPRVVVGCLDPFPQVSGRGVAQLRAGGVAVKVGVLQEACEALNVAFMTRQRRCRPYVILKWAESSDGYIDAFRQNASTPAAQLSTDATRRRVHQLRTRCDAILVGTQTALLDNPSLTVRHWYGKNPLRVVIDRSLRLPFDLRIFNDGGKTIVFTQKEHFSTDSVCYEHIEDWEQFPFEVLDRLRRHNIGSLLIEGGAATLQAFIDAECWDEARIEESILQIGAGVAAPRLKNGIKQETQQIGSSLLSRWVMREKEL